MFCLKLLNGKNEDMKLQWSKDLKSGDLSGVHAECLTDTWIGKDRWAFIDLSAGPFSWGPAVGGEGVRTELSLPNVEKTIGAVAGTKLLMKYINCLALAAHLFFAGMAMTFGSSVN